MFDWTVWEKDEVFELEGPGSDEWFVELDSVKVISGWRKLKGICSVLTEITCSASEVAHVWLEG